MRLIKWVWSVILLTVFFGTLAFLLNVFNQNKLIIPGANKLNKIFADLVIAQPTPPLLSFANEADLTLMATSTATLTLQPTKEPLPTDPYAHDPDLKNAAWGEAVQVSETGYRMKVGFDSAMGTAEETFQALNHYRYTKGKSNLTWDKRLAKYALERATYICQNGSDSHAGFSDYVKNQEGYKTLGFYQLGENMSTHMKFTGTHLIEWMYAADPAHDGNQLGKWSHVGVGIYEDCSALIFGNQMI